MKFKLETFEDTKNPIVERTLGELEKIKLHAIASGDEERANDCWRESESLTLTVTYIGAFQKIKDGRYRDAWNDLERCEIKCHFLKENSNEEFIFKKNIDLIADLVERLQSLYPYCVFSSPGFTVGYYLCGICGHKIRPRSRCAHTKGKVYAGKLCLHVAREMVINEISIVTKPVQKYSVVHNDETLDFSLLEYLMSALEFPFEEWRAIWSKKKFPIEMFSKVKPTDKCPCKNGKEFGLCCSAKIEVEIPHVDFVFRRDIENLPANRFPY